MATSSKLYLKGKFDKVSATNIYFFILSLSSLHTDVSSNLQYGENQTIYYLNMQANEFTPLVMAQIPVVLETEIIQDDLCFAESQLDVICFHKAAFLVQGEWSNQ